MGVDWASTMAYSKEENAIVERANKEVMRHLRNIVFDKDIITRWSDYLPLVQRIMNSSEHKITGVTPAEIMFGNSVDLDRGVMLERAPQTEGSTRLSQWISDMLKAQSRVIAIARNNLSRHDQVHMQTSPNVHDEFPINSYVLVEHRSNSLRKGPRSKLLPYLKGPMRVVNFSGSKYVLQDLVTKKNKDYHVSKIREFNYDPIEQDPLHYALKDDVNWFRVDRISHMRGNPQGPKSKLSFKVHWKGEDKPTYEPWNVVRKTEALQAYLSKHSKEEVRQLIPSNVELESDIEEELSDSESENEID